MKKYENHCKNFLTKVFYVESHKKDANIVELITNLKLKGLKKINLIEFDDNWLKKRLVSVSEGLTLNFAETPQFLNSYDQNLVFFKKDKVKMHQSSYENMKKFVQSNFKNLDSKKKLRVLDVGSLDVNGSYRNLFDADCWIYEGLDIEYGENVDFVPKDPYDWKELKSNTYDLIISGQALEHIEFPWKTFENIERVLKPSALCCIIAPSSGPEHKHPVDCWLLSRCMKALSNHSNLETISCSIIEQKTEDNSFELWKT